MAQNVFYEVQTYDKFDNIIACATYASLEDAKLDYEQQSDNGENVTIMKVDNEGYPLEEIFANFGH